MAHDRKSVVLFVGLIFGAAASLGGCGSAFTASDARSDAGGGAAGPGGGGSSPDAGHASAGGADAGGMTGASGAVSSGGTSDAGPLGAGGTSAGGAAGTPGAGGASSGGATASGGCTSDADCSPGAPHCDAGTCVECLDSTNCAAGLVCSPRNTCQCPIAGQIPCNGTCTDPSTDFNHCGGCATACDPVFASECAGGVCQCAAGLSACTSSAGARCRDLANDPRNCGTCGHACGDREICSAGACQCRPGLQRCSAPAGGNTSLTCVDTASDPNACGGCPDTGGHVCAANQACQGGACIAGGGGACQDPTPDACSIGSGRVACVNQNVDPLDCGQCGNVCADNELCVNGSCVRYAPATPCNSCPCTAACDALVGSPNLCCAGLLGTAVSVCLRDPGTQSCP